jgi:hypothetical protein
MGILTIIKEMSALKKILLFIISAIILLIIPIYGSILMFIDFLLFETATIPKLTKNPLFFLCLCMTTYINGT